MEMDEQQSKSLSERAGIIVGRLAAKFPTAWKGVKGIGAFLLLISIFHVVKPVWPYILSLLFGLGVLVEELWNTATIKGLLVILMVEGYVLIRVGGEIIKAVTPRCQYCGHDLTDGPAWSLHASDCPNSIDCS
jgi:hypothetical protein